MPTPAGRPATQLAQERQREYQAAHTMRRWIISAALATVVFVAAGIVLALASRNGSPAPSPRQATVQTTQATPTVNERGNIPKELGELAGFGSSDEPDQNTFAITQIAVDPPCSPEGTAPKSGHTVLLELEVKTGADAERAAQLGRILTPGFFSVVGPDGTEHDAWPGECTDPSHNLPEEFGAGQKYSGTVELRVPAKTGTLILAGNMDNAGGWEWTY